jgi:hypothetical protein
MQPSASTATRATWIVLFAAMAAPVPVYGIVLLLAGSANSTPSTPALPPADFFAASAACLFSSLAWTRWRLRPMVPVEPAMSTGPEPPRPKPAAFVRASLVSLALAEACAVVGLAHGLLARTGITGYAPFAVGSLAVMAFDVLPLGLRFWALAESDAGGPDSRAS